VKKRKVGGGWQEPFDCWIEPRGGAKESSPAVTKEEKKKLTEMKELHRASGLSPPLKERVRKTRRKSLFQIVSNKRECRGSRLTSLYGRGASRRGQPESGLKDRVVGGKKRRTSAPA